MGNRKKKTRIALIYSMETSFWTSCQVIVPNLVKAYKKALPGAEIKDFSLTEFLHPIEVWNLACKINDYNPDKIVFLDHRPSPDNLLRSLFVLYNNENRNFPKTYFHVFGDFTLYLRQWLSIEKILKNIPCIFIAASDNQLRLVSSFIGSPKKSVKKCHFPVDISKFYFSSTERNKTRNELGIGKSDFLLLYTGRISLQKNIISLLLGFSEFKKRLKNRRSHLYFAGNFDDLGSPFFGVRNGEGNYYQFVRSEINKLPAAIKNDIVFLGSKDANELRKLYNASDAYSSLSMHHDEDFGMSPAEALCCGTPSILSNWGGYFSFPSDSNACHLLNIDLTNKGLKIDLNKFPTLLLDIAKNTLSDSEREKISKIYLSKFSIDAASEVIKEIHDLKLQNIEGFNWRCKYFQKLRDEGVPFPEGPLKNTFYEEVYGSYLHQ